jgi:hypothetical protein
MIKIFEDRTIITEKQIGEIYRDIDRDQNEIDGIHKRYFEFKDKTNRHIMILYFAILAIAIGCIILSTQINQQ